MLLRNRTSPDDGSGPAPKDTFGAGADSILERSPLRQALDTAIAEANGTKLSMKDLTVLSPQIDPFRLDTPGNHKIGKWLADSAATLGLGGRKIHLRGLHYMIIGQPKPDETAYTNTEADWAWLSGEAGKAARFLGYIPFDQIVDHRNAAPTVRIFRSPTRIRSLTSASTSTFPM